MNNFLLILNTREKAQSLPPQISEVNRRENLFGVPKYTNEPGRKKIGEIGEKRGENCARTAHLMSSLANNITLLLCRKITVN